MYRYLLATLLVLPLLFACEGSTKARKAARGEHYVAEPNYLYFKNTRQRQYREDNRGEAGNYFYHDDLYGSEASLLPVIWDKWLEDEAYLELHTRNVAGPSSPSGPVTLVISSSTGANAVVLKPRPDRAAVEQLAHHLSTNRTVRVLLGQDTLEAFPGVARDHAREVLVDYLRLTE